VSDYCWSYLLECIVVQYVLNVLYVWGKSAYFTYFIIRTNCTFISRNFDILRMNYKPRIADILKVTFTLNRD